MKQIWEFLEEQLEVAEGKEMTVASFVTAANEVTIGGFWREHAKGELRMRKDHEILKFLSPCWEKIHGLSVLCERDQFRGLCTRTIEHAHKPLASPILSLPKIPV